MLQNTSPFDPATDCLSTLSYTLTTIKIWEANTCLTGELGILEKLSVRQGLRTNGMINSMKGTFSTLITECCPLIAVLK